MSRRYYNLPPLTTLSTFEAAARHLSFKNAAEELAVTPGAVSHQVKALEEELGAALFLRRHRGVELTREGQAVYLALAESFSRVSRTLATVRQSQNTASVTVGSTTAVASLWLSPAIIRFWRERPDLNVNQISQDYPFQDRPDLDLFIQYGRAPSGALTYTPLYRDTLVPVAAPDVARSLGRASLDILAQQRLIQMDSATRAWTTWTDWFEALGYQGRVTQGPSVNSYAVALQMAQQGAGIALGWRRLIAPILASGKLSIIGEAALPAPHQFYLVGRADADLSSNAQALKEWLLAEITRDTDENNSSMGEVF